MIRIFIDEKTVYFIGRGEKAGSFSDFFRFEDRSSFFEKLHDFLKDKKSTSLGVQHTSAEKLFEIFQSEYQLIAASGGLVKNNDGEVLMILRKGKWDLPKGKIEKGETPEIAAVREVEEECGITNLSITKEICVTYHCYELKGKKMVKKSHWYAMLCNVNQVPQPQTEEDITEVKWMTEKEVKRALKNTYPSIVEVVKAAGS